MIAIEKRTISDWYTHLVGVCLGGEPVSPRGKPNKEVRPVMIVTEEWSCLKPGISYKFALAEAMAVVCGWDDVAWLARFNPRISQFSDNGETFYGSYGVRLAFADHSLATKYQMDQLEDGLLRLKKDIESRQVVMNIWTPYDLRAVSKDLPCNTQLLVKVRDNRLFLSVVRRSSDIIWGVPYDHHVFWALLYTLANDLGVQPGHLTEYIDSLHVYEEAANFYDSGRVQKALRSTNKLMPHPWPNADLKTTRALLSDVRAVVQGDDILTPYSDELMKVGMEMVRYLK